MTTQFESSQLPLTSTGSHGNSTEHSAINTSLPARDLPRFYDDRIDGLLDLVAAMVMTLAVIAISILLATVDTPLWATRLLLAGILAFSIGALYFSLRGDRK